MFGDALLGPVVFRADASLSIGAGHVMRCLALANELRNRGAQTWFICSQSPGNLINLIAQHGHGVSALKDDHHPNELQDAQQTLAALTEAHPHIPASCFIVDHYQLGADWEKAVGVICRPVIAIDDLANRLHSCDLLIDQNLGRLSGDYENLVSLTSALLVGPKYALLRPEFAKLRPGSLERRHYGPGIQRIVVSMGGVDIDNFTSRVLDGLNLALANRDVRVTVVMGFNAPWYENVVALSQALRLDVQVLRGVSNMAELMADADLAIGAAGSTAWERCALGLPSIQVVLADNQRDVAKHLMAAGAAWSLHADASFESELELVFRSVLEQPSLLAAASRASALICDGLGVVRVAEKIVTMIAQH